MTQEEINQRSEDIAVFMGRDELINSVDVNKEYYPSTNLLREENHQKPEGMSCVHVTQVKNIKIVV